MLLELIKTAKTGNDDAFFQLVSSYREQLYRIAFSYLKNENDALEAIQETTCRAYQNLHKLKEPTYFKTWLIRILINYCIDEQKRKGRLQDFPKETATPHLELTFTEDLLMVEAALKQVKAPYQEVILLKYFEDLTIKEISSVINCPEGTVKTRLHRGLEALRKYFNRDGEFYV